MFASPAEVDRESFEPRPSSSGSQPRLFEARRREIGIRADGALRLPLDVEQAVAAGDTDARRQPGMARVAVETDFAFRSLEIFPEDRLGNLVAIEGSCPLQGPREQVNLGIGRLGPHARRR